MACYNKIRLNKRAILTINVGKKMQHTVEAVYFLKATQALHYVTYNWTTQYIKNVHSLLSFFYTKRNIILYFLF